MKTLYLDCSSGISGDMTLSALCELCNGFEKLKNGLSLLGLDSEFEIVQKKVVKNGITATHTHVHQTGLAHHHHGRSFAEIVSLIENSMLPQNIKSTATQIFTIIAEAEGKIHGCLPKDVCFHEVGCIDSIVDIVGVSILLDEISPSRIIASPLCEGHGTVQSRHGVIPVPVPATLEILRSAQIPIVMTPEEGEMITPTGAGIVAAICSSFDFPGGIVCGIGYGAGGKDFVRANVLRALLIDEQSALKDCVNVIEANIDDSTGEAIGLACQLLFEQGALDVYTIPIYMKKNRPGIILGVIASGDPSPLEDIILRHTSTIGLRKYIATRRVLPRSSIVVSTAYGDIRVKVSLHDDHKKYAPEYEDVQNACRKHNAPFTDVYSAACTLAAHPQV